MAFNRIEQDIGIKTLKQDERRAEPDTGEHSEKSAGVDHRHCQCGDLVSIEISALE
jgi:hypothetical protein